MGEAVKANEPWVDRLSKALAQGLTRKDLLRLIGAVAIGTLSSFPPTAEAQKPPKPPKPVKLNRNGKPCRGDAECSSKFCDPTSSTCAVRCRELGQDRGNGPACGSGSGTANKGN